MENEVEVEKNNSDDEISLIDLFAVLWRYKIMIILITLAGAIGVTLFSLISIKLPPEDSFLPNRYTPEAFMLIENSGGGGITLPSNLGGLASLIGVSSLSSSSNYSELAIYLTQSNPFLDMIVEHFDLIEKYEIENKPKTTSRKMIKDSLKAEFEGTNGVLTLSFTHIDPEYASEVVNFSITLLEKYFYDLGLDKNQIEKENLELNIANTFEDILQLQEESRRLEQSVIAGSSMGRIPAINADLTRIELELEAKKQIYTQLKVQLEMLKVTMASERPIFQILETAEVPEEKSGPSRGLICIIVTFAAGFLSVFLAFAINAVSNIKKDPVAMAKLKGTYEK